MLIFKEECRNPRYNGIGWFTAETLEEWNAEKEVAILAIMELGDLPIGYTEEGGFSVVAILAIMELGDLLKNHIIARKRTNVAILAIMELGDLPRQKIPCYCYWPPSQSSL